MRQLASYSFEAGMGAGPSAVRAGEVERRVEGWLSSKGEPTTDGRAIRFEDGRRAELVRARVESPAGRIFEATLTEPTDGGEFRTAFSVAETEDTVAVSVGLSAVSESLSPIYLDVHCPRVVRDLLSPPSPWRYGATRVSSAPLDFEGAAGGNAFVSLVWDSARALPVVAVSDEHGAVLHPGIVEGLARDLAGLAVVARLDPQTSWRVSDTKGKAWSCYNGAIRLYWPDVDPAGELAGGVRRHPLWTPTRMLTGEPDTFVAARRMRNQLRRRVLGQSAFAVRQPPVFARIRRAARQEELAELRSKLAPDADYEVLAEEYFEQLLQKDAILEEREAEIAALKLEVSNLQYAAGWKAARPQEETADEVEPDEETPPATVAEAVRWAMEECGDTLIFGAQVTEGESTETLAQDAGGPEKVLRYLRVLGEYTKAKRSGPLGMSSIKWLEDRNVIASGESDTISNSSKYREARTWDDGTGHKRYFDSHLKPKDSTSPDQCVRIYFDYDESSEKMVVGWVGTHP